MKNPFEAHRDILNSDYSAACDLRQLALHLYNGDNKAPNLSHLLAIADERHRDIALAMMSWYWAHGENDPGFMNVCRALAKQWL